MYSLIFYTRQASARKKYWVIFKISTHHWGACHPCPIPQYFSRLSFAHLYLLANTCQIPSSEKRREKAFRDTHPLSCISSLKLAHATGTCGNSAMDSVCGGSPSWITSLFTRRSTVAHAQRVGSALAMAASMSECQRDDQVGPMHRGTARARGGLVFAAFVLLKRSEKLTASK